MSKQPTIESLIIATKKSHPELSYPKIAKKLGCSISWVQKTMAAENKRKEEQTLKRRRTKLENEVLKEIKEIKESKREISDYMKGVESISDKEYVSAKSSIEKLHNGDASKVSFKLVEDIEKSNYRMQVVLYVLSVLLIFLGVLIWAI
jgi:viroplasmin and RNaseH domain-containing protein